MNDEDILDYFDGFDPDARVVTLRYFQQAAEAHLFAARLREAGIACFVSNVHITATLPMGGGGIGLQVKEQDGPAATRLLAQLDQQIRQGGDPVSYHDADHEDIEYLRQLNEKKNQSPDRIYLIILAIILLLILRAFLRASGLVENGWDPF